MKYTLKTTLAIAIIAFSTEASFAEIGKTTGDVFVRSAPSIEARAIGILLKGTTINYTSIPKHKDWFKFNYKNKTAYVGKKMVEQTSTSKTTTKEQTEVATKTNQPAQNADKPSLLNTFEIIPSPTDEELRLKAENIKHLAKIKELESEILPLKEYVNRLKVDLQAKVEQIEKIHTMFPYLKVVERVEKDGREVILAGIGKAKMIEIDQKVMIRVEGDAIASSDKVMGRGIQERYQTGSVDHIRVYYILSKKSVKRAS